MRRSPAATWRYALLPLLALGYPVWWLSRDGDLTQAMVAAGAGLLASGAGTLLVVKLRDRWTHEAHLQTSIAWTTVVGGALVPTFLVTGRLPSRRPYRRPDLDVQTWTGRLVIAVGMVSALFLLFWVITSPRRGGGWLQQRLATNWGNGLCDRCGMAIYYGRDRPCAYCGAVANPASRTDSAATGRAGEA